MTRADRFLRRLSIEPLENRQLLCGTSAGSSVLQSAAQSALLARSHQSSAISVSVSKHNSGGGGDENSNQSFLVTTLTNSAGTVEGTASFSTDTNGNQKLVITVVGAAASTSYAVSLNGSTDLGTLTTDANGNGKLILTSAAATTTSSSARSALSGKCGGGDSGATTGTLPTGFTLNASDTIALTSATDATDVLNGTFAVSTGSIGDGDGDGEGCHGDHGVTVARSVATLSDSASVTGKAVFTTITHADGSTDQILRVRITGAEAGATLDVSIDGTSVGSVTADDNGNASAIFSTNPKTSNVGQLPSGLSSTPTSISIGTTITGTFSAATWGGPSSLAALGGRLLGHRR